MSEEEMERGTDGGVLPAFRRPISSVLLTNDDGVSSPFFKPTIDALCNSRRFKQVCFAAPAEEQSWIGSAVSRFKPVYAEALKIESASGYIVSGTPSDCVFLGLKNLFDQPPDLVISGINIGTNTGRAFIASSGTISGAASAFFGGCRSIAISTKVPGEIFELWGRHDLAALEKFGDRWSKIAAAAIDLAIKLIEADFWRFADVAAIDLPWNCTAGTPVKLTVPGPTGYNKIFKQIAPGTFLHSFDGLRIGDPLARPEPAAAPCALDLDVISAEEISISPLYYSHFASSCPDNLSQLTKSLSAILKK